MVDGETLQMVVNCASVEQMQLCGLKIIKDQMKLRKVFATVCGNADSTFGIASFTTPTRGTSTNTSATPKGTRKLKLSEIKNLTPEEKRLYYMKRNKVASAARKEWPGNDIPCFKNNQENMKKLDSLVKTIEEECSLPFFGRQAIRRHILDTLTERRRCVKKGHDYEDTSGSAKKRLKLEESNEAGATKYG
ncbi:PREDICTED: uncharacterized protein LOC109581047 [Amphimedon queenslandica]|uniref:Uncharacterized protein n=1 Tax=Amphimedon queenslandica TaxID=400682 RepID=A0AAN0J0X6_AMPQE|nr:PREDICTED: uncharacterized protein LOC109581047 [Amphimedon queenslandica]|eukprot:XP_019850371.1 PREDICTED: uncharacterized protein LOC109581047 [Amphimedon queenslandica]